MRNEILRIDPFGATTTILDLGPAPPGGQGVLGLALNPRGDLYAAFASLDPATRGVYRIEAGTSVAERIPGSSGISFPNGLAFGPEGNLYVTDSFSGTVWRYRPGGMFEIWIRHALLGPVAVPGFPPLPGANGIAVQQQFGLFVANTSQGTIVRIPVERTGDAGTPGILASGLLGIDGLGARPDGPLYFVNAGANLLGIPAVLQVQPATGAVSPLTSDLAWFDDPTSITVGRGTADPWSIFVVNANIFPPTRAGAGVVAIGAR